MYFSILSPSCQVLELMKKIGYAILSPHINLAGVAKLVDAPGLGPGGGNTMEVQVLSPALH